MQLTDTHLHLYSEEYENLQRDLLDDALKKGINRFLLPNIDADSVEPMKRLMQQFPGQVYGMMGLHPCYVKEDYETFLQQVNQELVTGNYIAVGEIGIDLYWDKSTQGIQEAAFKQQCLMALHYDLPIAVHCRESFDLTADLIEDVNRTSGKKLRGVFHCFTGDAAQAQRAVSLGFYLGIGGVLTFKNSGLAGVLESIDPAHLLLETDGPYLAPVPHRGKRNNPEFLYLIAEKLADVKKMHLPELARITTDNVNKLFRLT